MSTTVQYHFQYPQTSQKYQVHLLKGGALFFFNPVNNNPKCIRNTIRNIIRNSLFRKIPKCIRNASQIPIFSLPAPLPWTNP